MSLSEPPKGGKWKVTRYWWRVIKHAYTDATTVLMTNPRKTGIGLLSGVLACVIFVFVAGPDEAIGKLMWILTCLAAGGIIFSIVFLFIFIRIPAKWDADKATATGGTPPASVDAPTKAARKTKEHLELIKQIEILLESRPDPLNLAAYSDWQKKAHLVVGASPIIKPDEAKAIRVACEQEANKTGFSDPQTSIALLRVLLARLKG